MIIPRGDRLMAMGVRMGATDLAQVIQNLCDEDAAGYLSWSWAANRRGYVFVGGGNVLATFEVTDKGPRVCRPAWLLEKAGEQGVPAESWLTGLRWARVLACCFGLRTLESNRSLGPKEVQDLVQRMESDKLTGYAVFKTADSETAVAWDRGQLLNETNLAKRGQLLTGRNEIATCLDAANAGGVRVWLYGEAVEVVEKEGLRIQENLERLTYLTPKGISGFFASKDTMKVDAEHFKRWGVSGTVQLGVEDEEGREIGLVKAQAAAGKGQTVEVPAKVLEGWGLKEGARVGLYPPV